MFFRRPVSPWLTLNAADRRATTLAIGRRREPTGNGCLSAQLHELSKVLRHKQTAGGNLLGRMFG